MTQRKTIVGVIHLLPLPGTPCSRHTFQQVLERAKLDAQALKEGGVHMAILENFGDAPFVRGSVEPHIVSMMTVIALKIKELGLELGINVLRNDARSALAIASAVGAKLIRVNVHTGAAWTDQGLIQGDAYHTLLYKRQLNVDVEIAADIMVKHATPAGTRSMLDAAKDTLYRGQVNHIIVTGTATGATIDLEDLKELRNALPKASIWIGSGLNLENVRQIMNYADGGIVGTYFHREGELSNPLDASRVRDFCSTLFKTKTS
jgi:membrane complex biogenesis BtpA family protein